MYVLRYISKQLLFKSVNRVLFFLTGDDGSRNNKAVDILSAELLYCMHTLFDTPCLLVVIVYNRALYSTFVVFSL